MAYNFLPYDQDQMLLLPPSLADWVKEGSLARFVSDTIDMLDEQHHLDGFYEGLREDGWGRAAYHPRMMVKILTYCYCHGVTSSRKIARALKEDVSLRYLSGNTQPDFRTISDFRKNHIQRLQQLFVDVLALCQEAGLAKMGRVALDGRKVAGNASLQANRTQESLEKEIRKMFEEAERIDAEEDRLYGPDKSGDELPEGLRHKADRLKRLRQAQQRLAEQKRQAEQERAEKIARREEEERRTGKKKRGPKLKAPEEKKKKKEPKANVTDPESRILKTRNGWKQGYNGQAVADCQSQVIVAQDVTQEENDVKQLEPMLKRCKEQAGKKPTQMLADAGYWSEDNIELCKDQTDLCIATTKDYKQRKALKDKPVPRGPIPKDITPRDRMERKLLTKAGRAAYKQRSYTIEPVFGQMANRGLVRFALRGVHKVRGEWALWCATHNLLKLWRSGWLPSSG